MEPQAVGDASTGDPTQAQHGRGVALISDEDTRPDLDHIRTAAAGPVEGVFGPGSMFWRINREAAVFLGAGRALLLQLAHPWVAAAIADHSHTFADPIGRFHRTFNVVFTMVFGTLDQALTASMSLHRIHGAISGVLSEAVGPFTEGSFYRANEVSALRWVHATLVDTALTAHNLLLPALTTDEQEQYWAEARIFGALFGIPADCLPSDWASFAHYNTVMMESASLTVSPTAREIAGRLLFGRATRWRPPLWYQALTIQMTPDRLRAGFGLSFGALERGKADRALARIRRVYPLLPTWIRTVGPYQEAETRLRGATKLDSLTRVLNHVWIGRQRMGYHGLMMRADVVPVEHQQTKRSARP